jgi:tRNA(fMet)-specific endonuclease VapC
MFLPDTNAFSNFLRQKSSALSGRMAEARSNGELLLSSIVLQELEYGAEKAKLAGEARPRRRVDQLRASFAEVAVYDETAAGAYGKVRATLERSGFVIGNNDMMIAAHSLSLGATVVTHNAKEFARVPGLKVENWQVD